MSECPKCGAIVVGYAITLPRIPDAFAVRYEVEVEPATRRFKPCGHMVPDSVRGNCQIVYNV